MNKNELRSLAELPQLNESINAKRKKMITRVAGIAANDSFKQAKKFLDSSQGDKYKDQIDNMNEEDLHLFMTEVYMAIAKEANDAAKRS